MATQRREVIWTLRAHDALDEAAAHIALDSPNAAVDLVESALKVAESLDTLSERGHIGLSSKPLQFEKFSSKITD